MSHANDMRSKARSHLKRAGYDVGGVIGGGNQMKPPDVDTPKLARGPDVDGPKPGDAMPLNQPPPPPQMPALRPRGFRKGGGKAC